MLQKSVEIVALEMVLAHFPNVVFVTLDAELVFGAEVAAELPSALMALRARLEKELERLRDLR